MSPVKLNGYGVIGKRAADTVTLKPDMRNVDVVDVAPGKVGSANMGSL